MHQSGRRTTSFVVATCLALLIAAAASAAPFQWTVGSGGNGHWYAYVDFTGNWEAANAHANATSHLGVQGHLVTLTSDAEDLFVASQSPGGGVWGLDAYWLGGYQDTGLSVPTDESWHWVTGETWSYTNWLAGEPNDDYEPYNYETYLVGLGHDTWNDLPGASVRGGYLVEYDTPNEAVPEPATLGLLGLGLAGLIAKRRRMAKS